MMEVDVLKFGLKSRLLLGQLIHFISHVPYKYRIDPAQNKIVPAVWTNSGNHAGGHEGKTTSPFRVWNIDAFLIRVLARGSRTTRHANDMVLRNSLGIFAGLCSVFFDLDALPSESGTGEATP